VADAISRLDFTPKSAPPNQTEQQNWMTVTKCWCTLNKDTQSMNHDVFANHSEDDEIFPITVKEIAKEQKKDKMLKALAKSDKYETLLIESIKVLCNDGKLVIPKSLQKQVVQWYHHYLQHPGHTRLEETLRTAMYWKSMRTSI
jgi:hypothetical protein